MSDFSGAGLLYATHMHGVTQRNTALDVPPLYVEVILGTQPRPMSHKAAKANVA